MASNQPMMGVSQDGKITVMNLAAREQMIQNQINWHRIQKMIKLDKELTKLDLPIPNFIMVKLI